MSRKNSERKLQITNLGKFWKGNWHLGNPLIEWFTAQTHWISVPFCIVERWKLKVESYGKYLGTKKFSICNTNGQLVQTSSKHEKRVHSFKTVSTVRNQHRCKHCGSAAGTEQSRFYLQTEHCTERNDGNEVLDQTHVRNRISIRTRISLYLFRLCRTWKNVGCQCKDFKRELTFHFTLSTFN